VPGHRAAGSGAGKIGVVTYFRICWDANRSDGSQGHIVTHDDLIRHDVTNADDVFQRLYVEYGLT